MVVSYLLSLEVPKCRRMRNNIGTIILLSIIIIYNSQNSS